MDFGGHPYTLESLVDYTKTAARSGFTVLGANDHLVFAVPWLDAPTALAATMEYSGRMPRATTVTLAVVRGPVTVAKTLGAIDRLSGGRMLAVVGPGSSPADYASVGLDFAERWARLDEAVPALRALWRPGSAPFVRRFYSTAVGRRSGWGAGAPTRACGASPDWPTAGWRRRTTPRPNCSPTRVRAWASICVRTGRNPTCSRTGWRRCGSTSRRTAPRLITSFASGWHRRFTAPPRSCANVCRSALGPRSPS